MPIVNRRLGLLEAKIVAAVAVNSPLALHLHHGDLSSIYLPARYHLVQGACVCVWGGGGGSRNLMQEEHQPLTSTQYCWQKLDLKHSHRATNWA